jgi:hypothetical protein
VTLSRVFPDFLVPSVRSEKKVETECPEDPDYPESKETKDFTEESVRFALPDKRELPATRDGTD